MINTITSTILEYENILRDGKVPEEQVRAQTKAFARVIENNLATKDDLKSVKDELKNDIFLVQKDIKILETSLKKEITLSELRISKKVSGLMIGCTGILALLISVFGLLITIHH